MTEIALATLLLTLLTLLLTGLVMGARRVFQPASQVHITVNGKTAITGTSGEKLLTVLKRGNIAVPSACAGAGTCGLCRVRVADGGAAPLPTEMALLNANEVRGGMRLACQVVVRGALSVEVPDDILAAQQWDGTLLSSTMLAPLIKELVLQLPGDAAGSLRAGSFVQVSVAPYALDFAGLDVAPPYEAVWSKYGWRDLRVRCDAPTSRAYSVANRPSDSDAGRLVLNVRLAVPPPTARAEVQPGIVSSYLFGAQVGATLAVSGPFGDFRVRDTEREMILIAGGVGMAPLRAIIFDELERKRSLRRMSFWYGARSWVDVFYADEFSELARRHDNFSWTVALSDPEPTDAWTGPVGLIHEVAYRSCLESHPAPEQCEYYLCGPPLMIQAVMTMLDELGVSSDSIFFDDFGS